MRKIMTTCCVVVLLLAGACRGEPGREPAPSQPPAPASLQASESEGGAPRERALPQPRVDARIALDDVDLEADEARGGHTIARHVGRTEAQLRARLKRESISAASTYPDLDTAERVVSLTLRESAARVRRWTARSGPRANLALRYRARDGLPVGMVLRRSADRAVDALGAVVVLRWSEDGPYVLTSYPEERR